MRRRRVSRAERKLNKIKAKEKEQRAKDELAALNVNPLATEFELSRLLSAAIAQLCDWALPLLEAFRYKVLYGGRGGGKSYGVADALLILGLMKPLTVLCAREYQVSIKKSVYALLKIRIKALGLEAFYHVSSTDITAKNGTEFFFMGMQNPDSIKSIPALTHVWLEEAQSISAASWEVLTPTVRDTGSEIWVTFNPKFERDVVYQEFVANANIWEAEEFKIDPSKGAYIRKVNYYDNPNFPEVLDAERKKKQRTDIDAYRHIWLGELWTRNAAQVLNGKWVVADFVPGTDWDGPYFGGDFGFASDPTALGKFWIYKDKLYVERESYREHLETVDMPGRWRADIPGCEGYIVYCDSARPETISHLKKHGIPRAKSVSKTSIEDGIEHLRSFDQIVVHTRCTDFANEALLYSYKVDKQSGDVLPKLIDKHNHLVDACRYAMTPILKRQNTNWLANV